MRQDPFLAAELASRGCMHEDGLVRVSRASAVPKSNWMMFTGEFGTRRPDLLLFVPCTLGKAGSTDIMGERHRRWASILFCCCVLIQRSVPSKTWMDPEMVHMLSLLPSILVPTSPSFICAVSVDSTADAVL